jgi:hypothetical protein
MIGDPTEGCSTASDEEGRIDLPTPKRHVMGAQPALAATTPRLENPPTVQATATTPSLQATPRSGALAMHAAPPAIRIVCDTYKSDSKVRAS